MSSADFIDKHTMYLNYIKPSESALEEPVSEFTDAIDTVQPMEPKPINNQHSIEGILSSGRKEMDRMHKGINFGAILGLILFINN